MSLVACGSIHQGHELFSEQSRGKQCSFMCLSALLTAQAMPVLEWNSITVDNILLRGDSMYRNAFENSLIPRERYLSINELPTVVPWSMNDFQVQIQLNDNETQIQPNVNEAHIQPNEAQIEPNEGQIVPNETHTQPDEAQIQPSEGQIQPGAQSDEQNDKTIWYINYGKDRQVSIITNDHDVGAPYLTLVQL